MAPLTGIKVVEFGIMIAVPGAAETLAGFGAEVIKVEDTNRGDELRSYGSNKNGMSGWFANANAGKRSISVDLSTDAGKEVMWELLSDADVFIQGFRSGVVDKFGFGYEAVSARFPTLIYCSSTGFGESGPYADLPAYDPIVQALSGWAGIQKVDGDPTLHKTMVSDKTAASFNTKAILAALVQRGRTAKGCYIEASMLESNIMFNWPDVMMQCTLLDDDASHVPNIFVSYRLYECTDGWVTVACGTDKQWQAYCTALEQPDVANDPKFRTPADRGAHIPELFDATAKIAARFDVETVVQRLRAADVPVAPVHTPEAVRDDPQIRAREFIKESSHPVAGQFLGPKTPASMFGEDLELSPAPVLGEHTREILTELGFTSERIETLLGEGVIRTSD
ncbi:MAG: CoA transferase [Gammaproteobacteria bacterium]|jgi:crotonobetainyl-CoA:carnitine CoA-transferase CaiB-like acyl-CoA transferase|nr:CoA transferase [Gammaproteobacteria bacterium]MBT4492697.1 CoA transferase [Gammaproteobacteria bacterium]MBT7371474.1 CoA transferase [Gammaproteobacteria bacterium]